MATTEALPVPGFLARERTIAGPGFSRWLVPPAALAIHLCIGMAYGFSVFWLPLSKAIGITESVACPADISFIGRLTSTTCDWKLSMLGWTYTLFFVFLGSAAAIWGGWLERAGPRKAGVVAAICWCGGLVISAFGVMIHQLWLMWLGSGIIGGIGLGLGYISPVSTLIKWFPDRRGMATGMAIMGFGGGAMIGAPLADKLMKFHATPQSVGVWETFLTMAAIYFVFMMAGALSYRVPPEGWQPANWNPAKIKSQKLVTDKHVHLHKAWRTPQFWLLWGVLTLNVSAGIGILGMASPLLQEVFGGRLIGVSATLDQLTPEQKTQIAAIAAGFTGLLSLFNIGGRIFWASLSDRIGRKVPQFDPDERRHIESLRRTIETLLARFRPFIDRNRAAARQHHDELMTCAMSMCAARLLRRNLIDGEDAPDEKWNMTILFGEHQSSAQVRCLGKRDASTAFHGRHRSRRASPTPAHCAQ